MPTEKTPQQWVHDRFKEILSEAEESLRVDSRTVRIVGVLPEQAPQASRVPMICVERPEEDSRRPWGGGYDRIELVGRILIVDACRVSEGGPNEADERLSRMLVYIEKALRETSNMGLAFLHVYQAFLKLDRQEAETLNNNMRGLPVVYTLPVIVERGTLFSG